MTAAPTTKPRAAYVVVDGPYPTRDREGDEIPQWSVVIYSAQEAPLREYHTFSHARARTLGAEIARDRRIELVDDSTPA